MAPYKPLSSLIVTPLKTVVGEGFNTPINLTITNLSLDEETFNVTVQADTTTIHVQTVTLQGGGSAKISFTWNTTGYAKGTYQIAAQATTTNGKRDTFYAFPPRIFISIPGDINADRLIDIYDVVMITSVYDAKRGDAEYHPNKDINNDAIIDIFDVVICTSHYDQTW